MDSDSPIALQATQIRRWAGVRADISEDGKQQHPVEWDAPARDTGGAEYTVGEAMLELESFDADAGPRDPGAVTMLTDFQKAVGKGQAESRMEPGSILQFPVLLSRDALRVLRAPETGFFRGQCNHASADIHSNIASEQVLVLESDILI